MITKDNKSAKIVVDQAAWAALINTASYLVNAIHRDPTTIPWPLVNGLEQAVERATDPRLWTSEKDKVY